MSGSRSSASSGPRPNSSFRTSTTRLSRSTRLSGVVRVSLPIMLDDQIADLRLGLLARHAVQPLEVQAIQELLVDAGLQLLIVAIASILPLPPGGTRKDGIHPMSLL